MELQPDPPLIVASLLILAILVSSAALWIRHIQDSRRQIVIDNGVPAWPIGWVDFGIFACAMVITVFVVQNVAAVLFLSAPIEGEAPQELTPRLAVIAVLLLQLPMLAVFYAARRFYPGHYASQLNNAELTVGVAFRQAVPLFLMCLPLIWIASLIWTHLLTALEAAGAIDTFEPQTLITLFQDGGDPIAISLLVALAILLAPIVEEIVFRGCVYRFLKSQTTLLPAQILSGCVFSFMHWNLMSFVPLVIVGVFLARVYEKSGNLMVAIWFHAFFNAFSLLMLFITGLSEAIPQ
jgi:membrane protease YdiL (CAAX protease family)